MKKTRELPPLETLQRLFYYDHWCFELRWNISKHRVTLNAIAGHLRKDGYRHIMIDGVPYLAHRLIWSYFNGYLSPEFEIDHRDGNPRNNRIENLRLATASQNQHNEKLPKNNKSGVKGISFHKQTGLWRAEVMLNYVKHYKHFASRELAEEHVKKLREELHLQFTNHGD